MITNDSKVTLIESGNGDVGSCGATMIYDGSFMAVMGHKNINPQEIGSRVDNISIVECEVVQIFHNMESLEVMVDNYIELRDIARARLKELEVAHGRRSCKDNA